MIRFANWLLEKPHNKPWCVSGNVRCLCILIQVLVLYRGLFRPCQRSKMSFLWKQLSGVKYFRKKARLRCATGFWIRVCYKHSCFTKLLNVYSKDPFWVLYFWVFKKWLIVVTSRCLVSKYAKSNTPCDRNEIQLCSTLTINDWLSALGAFSKNELFWVDAWSVWVLNWTWALVKRIKRNNEKCQASKFLNICHKLPFFPLVQINTQC